jgi:two-component system chemotaxis response regulator CheY
MTVLIVDDSSVMRKVIGRTLSQAGLEMKEVLEAANGLDALTLLRARTPDHAPVQLILSDINMPVMDGFEFMGQLRADALSGVGPVVVISTEAGEAHVRRALAAGAAGYIRKPFTAEQIKATVTRLVTTL